MSATTSRRVALKAGAGFLGAAIATAPTLAAGQHPDAELLGTVAEFERHERRLKAAPTDDEDAFDQIADGVSEAQQPHVDRMCELQAVTLDGLQARAAALKLWEPALANVDHRDDTQSRMIAALVRDAAVLRS